MSRYETVLTATTGSIAAGAAATLSLSIAGANNSIDIKKIKVVPSVVGSGELTKVELYKRSTCLAADRCFSTMNFEGSLYAPKFDDGTGPAELNEAYVCDYEDLDATGKLNVKLFNNGPSAKTFTYYITYEQKPQADRYTPTLFNTTNISASTPYEWSYMRMGNICIVYFIVDIVPTAAVPTPTELQATLPFPSAFTTAVQAMGCGNCDLVPAQTSVCVSNAANDRVSIGFDATSTANATHAGSFAYQILP